MNLEKIFMYEIKTQSLFGDIKKRRFELNQKKKEESHSEFEML